MLNSLNEFLHPSTVSLVLGKDFDYDKLSFQTEKIIPLNVAYMRHSTSKLLMHSLLAVLHNATKKD